MKRTHVRWVSLIFDHNVYMIVVIAPPAKKKKEVIDIYLLLIF